MGDGAVAPPVRAALLCKKAIRGSGSAVVGVVAASVNVPVVGAGIVLVFDMLGLGLELIQKCSHG